MSQSQQQTEDGVENPTMNKLRRWSLSIVKEACPLSISTRAIGFMLSEFTSYVDGYPDDDSSSDEVSEDNRIKAPLSAMYRVSLAQLEAKVHHATSNQTRFLNASIHDPSLFDLDPSSLLYDVMKRVKSYPYNTSPLSAIINSIGHVHMNGMHYKPVFTKKITPLNLRISNLRKYCEDMANPNTAAEHRKTGYLLNSIPNAEWENENDLEFVVLKNPDDIIAANYDRNLLSRDLSEMTSYLNVIHSRKKLKFGRTINYDGFGDPGILASTHVKPEQSRRLDEMNKHHNSCMESTFWSREPLTPVSWSIGVLSLAGEVLNPIDVHHRSQMLAKAEHDGVWENVSDVLLRN